MRPVAAVELIRCRGAASDPEPPFILAASLLASNIKRTLTGEVEGSR